ncbi:MAG: Gfo/Idh/MocA family oxidoreductase [Acidobacteriaceae bacterium]|nr:Gfo/Idh/MocA family oxidoreductase [Acidobacteriaceae bacterium]
MALFGQEKDDSQKIRYAVVGLGWITQEVVLPAFKKTKYSELTAFVTGDPTKAQELGKKYDVSQSVGYEGYDELLRSGSIDAVYIALPNNMHKDYTMRAAGAGVHVLCEKPMADNVAECEEMIRAAEEGGVKLMIAYRLHFEPANLKAIEIIKSGEIGEPRIFSSVFSQQVVEGNIRLKKALGGGPLMDMGVYPINAARYLFQDEPTEVTGVGANGGDPRFSEVHEMATGILRFPGDRLGVFTCSFGASAADAYQVVGTKGELRLKPGFDYHEPYKLQLKIEGKEKEISIDKVDQFGAEIEYFSQCILNDAEPEPSGVEGLADVRIVQGLLESMRSGRPVKLGPFEKRRRPGQGQGQKFEKSPVKPEKKLVHAERAAGQ